MNINEYISSMPKVEQHVHLEGTVSPEMAVILADRNGCKLPDGFIENGEYSWNGFDEFINAYDIVASCIKTASDYSDIIYDYLIRSADENVIFCEMGYSPYHGMVNARLSHKELVACLSDGIDRAKEKTGIECRLLCTVVRFLGNIDAVKIAEDIAMYLYKHDEKYVTGFGIAGLEREDDILAFEGAFEIAHKAGKSLTAHAGENCGSVSIRNSLKAIPCLKRIGHGVRILEDKRLIEEIIAKKIVLEVCPSSNIKTAILRDIDDVANHPLRKLMDLGIRCTVNSDDPPFFHSSIGNEYQLLYSKMGFSIEEIMSITNTAIESAFVEDSIKTKLQGKFANFASMIKSDIS